MCRARETYFRLQALKGRLIHNPTAKMPGILKKANGEFLIQKNTNLLKSVHMRHNLRST
ncbi:hypothetical protein GCM10010954_06160 [Halobacillus andaensis]|uniref:Uncharacterized protein n=1 Tax=Halobacillus andaensis TaxID=1176239 RepID=A0A917AZD4_HALAA|nr:hypothetical protein GCM10010954_06160 [Halobacillus andaensis]